MILATRLSLIRSIVMKFLTPLVVLCSIALAAGDEPKKKETTL
jgi:hypothetical protein